MTPEEAWNAVQEGYYVTTGGYTYGNGIYFAYGTFPGCVRGGKIDRSSFDNKGEWRKLTTLADLIKHTGYWPGVVSSMFAYLKDMPYAHEALTNEQQMIAFMVNSEHSADDFKNTFKVERIWSEYFDKDVNDDRGSTS